MKKTLLLIALLVGAAKAATINVGNLNDPNTSNGIVLSNGTQISAGAGSVQIGYFNGVADVAGASLDSLVSTFTPYGNVIDFGAGLGANSLFQGTVNGAALDGTEFSGKALYLVITNSGAGFTGAGVTAASQFLVWNPNISLPAGEPFASSINVQAGAGALVQGGFNNFSLTFDAFGGTQAVGAYNLIPVPEPSIALLGLLGVVGFFRRRR